MGSGLQFFCYDEHVLLIYTSMHFCVFLLQKFLAMELLCQDPESFNCMSPDYSWEVVHIYPYANHVRDCPKSALTFSAISAGKTTGGVVGEDIAWQWLDTQCPVHYSVLASGWPQATLHNPRSQMGNSCTLRRLWGQGKNPMLYSYVILQCFWVETLS